MATLLPKSLINEVEHTLRRASLSGQRIHVAVGRTETGTAQFANLSLLRYLDTASVLVASRVKAETVQSLFNTQNPSFDVTDTLRLRGVTPNINGTLARRRTTVSNEFYKARGATPSAESPVFVFEAGEFFVEGDSVDPAGAAASFVDAPLTVQNTEASVGLTGGSLDSSGFLAEKHEETIAYLVDVSGSSTDGDEYTARILDASNGDLDTTAPDSTYDVHYFDHACAQLERRHKSAVVEFASALSFASLAEQDALEAGLSNFGDEITGSLMPAFDMTEQGDE